MSGRAGRDSCATALPGTSAWMIAWFVRYVGRYLRRHFNAVRLNRYEPLIEAAQHGPLIVYLNHPAWWDPLVCAFLSDRLLPGRRHYGLIDATQLQRYRFFSRLGFIGVAAHDAGSLRALRRLARTLGAHADAALWLTPQGRFSDPRERPLRLEPGIGHLARWTPNARFLPIAVEYPFWEEKRPEVLVAIGEPFRPADHARLTSEDYAALFASRLESLGDRLAIDAIRRDESTFETLLDGEAGIGGIYDHWRRGRAWLRGRRFEARHGRTELR